MFSLSYVNIVVIICLSLIIDPRMSLYIRLLNSSPMEDVERNQTANQIVYILILFLPPLSSSLESQCPWSKSHIPYSKSSCGSYCAV